MGAAGRWSPVRPDPVRPGQESVWDYPRPPRLESDSRLIEIRVRKADGSAGPLLASSSRCWRVLETSHPPVFYVPRADVLPGVLRGAGGGSVCEFKGPAAYWDVLAPDGAVPEGTGLEGTALAGTLLAAAGAWSYERPWAGFEALAGALAFYPAPFVCTVDGEHVRPQPGGFYGGWITDDVAGPFKGAPGTLGW